MDEFELIKNYFQELTKKNPSALKLNDDVFFDKDNKIIANGIITCLNTIQAEERANPNKKNKGGEAAKAIINSYGIS